MRFLVAQGLNDLQSQALKLEGFRVQVLGFWVSGRNPVH